MEIAEDKIKKLKSDRFKLRDKLSLWDKNNKDYDKGLQLAIEYDKIINELKRLGVNTESRVKYVTKSYWEEKLKNGNLSTQKITSLAPSDEKIERNDQIFSIDMGAIKSIIQNTIKEEFDKRDKPTSFTYIVTIAWTQRPGTNMGDMNYLTNYLNEFGMNCTQPIGIHQINSNKEEEFILKYEFSGTEQEYKVIKKSVQYILDNIYENKDIGVSWRKKY